MFPYHVTAYRVSTGYQPLAAVSIVVPARRVRTGSGLQPNGAGRS